ncbi:5444_t:CDS:2 [Entrophospora sp. SA101]|nr:5444_t:CDS:2 [Entrophospora sp. SA101]
MEFVNIDNKVSEEFSYAEIIETVHPSQNNEVAEDEDEGIEPEPSIPVKIKMVNQIQPPALNEISTTFDTFLDENGHDYIIRNPQTSAWNQRDILNKIITASRQHIHLNIVPKLAQIPVYIGQEPPNDC